MNIEEAKKIIENKIQADEAAREVRKHIKSYVHEKQNLREGFTETFKPLIETSEKVKESIDTQQNKLIKQLQENQLALTQGFEGNRLALTSALDKMDTVNKWELSQLPGFEAIQEPEKDEDEAEDEDEDEDDTTYQIRLNDIKVIRGRKPDFTDPRGKEIYPIELKTLINILKEKKFDSKKYIVLKDEKN